MQQEIKNVNNKTLFTLLISSVGWCVISIVIIGTIPPNYSSKCYTLTRILAKPMNYNTTDIFVYNSTEYQTFFCTKLDDSVNVFGYNNYNDKINNDTLVMLISVYGVCGVCIIGCIITFIASLYKLLKK